MSTGQSINNPGYIGSCIASVVGYIPSSQLIFDKFGQFLGLPGTLTPEQQITSLIVIGGALLTEAGIALASKNKSDVLRGAKDTLAIGATTGALIYGNGVKPFNQVIGNAIEFGSIVLGSVNAMKFLQRK